MCMYSVLIVDDEKINCSILKNTFELSNAEVITVFSGYEALEILENKIPDVILMDINMPGIDGIETAEKIFEQYNIHNIPIIFISALDDQETILKCFRVGATDFIKKPFDIHEVLARVESHVKTSRKLKSKFDEILIDQLTGAYNRKAMKDTLEYNLELLKRNNGVFSLCYIDLDKFKELNDTYGHKAGDAELIKVADTFKNAIRKTDLFFRVGGDEFLTFFNSTEAEQVEIAINRIKGLNSFSLDFSYGIVQINNGNYSIDEICHLADIEMYKNKKEKKGK